MSEVVNIHHKGTENRKGAVVGWAVPYLVALFITSSSSALAIRESPLLPT
ncbi:hypothetical protein [[Phormidium] sp. ETS-05]|nr:hypothetical protein [[Phormidium] sp. ETS-05]